MNKTALIIYIFMLLALSSPLSRAQGRASSLKDTAESLLVDAVQDYDAGDLKDAMARLSVITPRIITWPFAMSGRMMPTPP